MIMDAETEETSKENGEGREDTIFVIGPSILWEGT